MERFQKANAHFERIGHLIGLQWFGYFLRTMVPVLVAKAHELPFYYFRVGLTLCPILWVIHCNPWTMKRVKVELTDIIIIVCITFFQIAVSQIVN